MPEARVAYQKALSMSQQEPEKRFLKKDWPQIDRGKSAEPMPFDCERIVYSGFGRLITMEK